MDFGLKNKVAIVAAASKGLGRAIAHELATEQAKVVICARNAGDLNRTRDEIAQRTGAEVHAVVADVATLDGIDDLVAAATEKFKHVDVLVNNDGGPPSARFEQHTWATWEAAVDLTLRSAVELTRRLLPG